MISSTQLSSRLQCREPQQQSAFAPITRDGHLNYKATILMALATSFFATPDAFAQPYGQTVRVAIVDDCSGSTTPNRIPPLTESDLSDIARLAIDQGGSVQAFIIGRCTDKRPYVYMPPPPAPPKCLKIGGSCVEQWRRYRKEDTAWRTRHDKELKSFSKRAKELLTERSASISDVAANLGAALNFLRAPAAEASVKRILYLNSDMQERPRSKQPLPNVPADVVVVWLNPDGIGEGRLPSKGIYTSHEEAVRFLAHHVNQWRAATASTTTHVVRDLNHN